VEDGYHQNPYHNAVHAADVTQAVNCFMLETKVGLCVCVCTSELSISDYRFTGCCSIIMCGTVKLTTVL